MAELEQENGNKKSLKSLIIMIVVGLVLLAAGGGATFFLMKDHLAKEGGSEESESAMPVEKFYFDMTTPIVVAFPKGASIKNARIMLSILVEGPENLAILKKNEPMIRNNLLMLIGAQDSRGLNTREGKEALRAAMLDDVTEVLVKMSSGKGQVKEIFFTSFIMQ